MYIAVLTAVALTLPQTDSLRISYVGNAGFELSDGATTLLVDLPYESGAFDLMTYDPSSIEGVGATVAVITHRHADHFDPTLFLAKEWLVFGPSEVAAGLPADRVIHGDEQRIGEFVVRRFRTPHRDTEHYSILIVWGGRRLYFVGDTEDPGHMLGMRGLDVLFVTPWLTCAMERVGGTPDAHELILHHQFPDGRLDVCGNPRIVKQGDSWSISAAS